MHLWPLLLTLPTVRQANVKLPCGLTIANNTDCKTSQCIKLPCHNIQRQPLGHESCGSLPSSDDVAQLQAQPSLDHGLEGTCWEPSYELSPLHHIHQVSP